ncbi:MAG: PQQ-binding-like beta-propeller repeat protein [Gemmataceae bacterium]|nr:PQQ-binding-like beta-propeller repeat protein [Gemmataceae bacterium]
MDRTAAGIAGGLVLVAALAAGVGFAVRDRRPEPDDHSGGSHHQFPRPLWTFEAPKPGSAVAAPVADGRHVYLAAIHARGFRLSGAVYALDPATGKPRWTFDRDGDMRPTASSPVAAGGRLFVGEGMHADFHCRGYCLDPATGRELWSVEADDHIEGGPAVHAGAVYFSAGNEGVVAADAATGAVRWRSALGLHVDSGPTAADAPSRGWLPVPVPRVFVGSGPSRRFKATEVVCLDAATGRPVWRTPVPLPAWASPVVAGGAVYSGLGTGRLTEGAKPPETPAGGLACLDARTGELGWTFPVGDAVFGRVLVSDGRVLFGSRDGNLYAVGPDGREAWRLPMGGPVVGGPAAGPGGVYAVSVGGRVVRVDAATGTVTWRDELARPGLEPHVYAPPLVAGARLYVAAELRPPGTSAGIVTLFCYDIPSTAHEGGG